MWEYDPDRYRTQNAETHEWYNEPRWDGHPYDVKGFYDKTRAIAGSVRDMDDGIWPREFQNIEQTFSRKGIIKNWDYDPEYKEGDFFDLKDIDIGDDNLNGFVPTNALLILCEVYKYWIAFADIDGYRVDTVKHMGKAATRFFCREIKEFAVSIGKQNFYLIGEVTGGRMNALETVGVTGLNAALGIDDVQDKLEYIVKGKRNPEEYFNLFGNSKEVKKGSHVWFNNKVVTMIDDHDQIRKGNNKARFCAADNGEKLIYSALALNLATMGIPCIYYGTEQYFDGQGGDDRYIRECMFGGDFGAFRSSGKHFFNDTQDLYRKIAALIHFRTGRMEMRRGRQYLRRISGDGTDFGYPRMIFGNMISIVAWSRIFNNMELVCAINNSLDSEVTSWVEIDGRLNKTGEAYECVFPAGTGQPAVVETRGSTKAIRITVSPASFAVYGKKEKPFLPS